MLNYFQRDKCAQKALSQRFVYLIKQLEDITLRRCAFSVGPILWC